MTSHSSSGLAAAILHTPHIADDMDKWYARLEAGFVAGNILLQGSAMGIGCWFTTDLTGEEHYRICETAGPGAEDVPFVIVSMGYV
jgi:nitroreductase